MSGRRRACREPGIEVVCIVREAEERERARIADRQRPQEQRVGLTAQTRRVNKHPSVNDDRFARLDPRQSFREPPNIKRREPDG